MYQVASVVETDEILTNQALKHQKPYYIGLNFTNYCVVGSHESVQNQGLRHFCCVAKQFEALKWSISAHKAVKLRKFNGRVDIETWLLCTGSYAEDIQTG